MGQWGFQWMNLLEMLVLERSMEGGEVWGVEKAEETCLFASDVVNADSP